MSALEPLGDASALPEPPQGWRSPTGNSVQYRLVELNRLLGEAANEADRVEQDYAESKQRFEVAFAKAFLTSEQTSDMKREYDAVDQTADLRMEMEINGALLASCKRRLDTIREFIRVGQSLGAAARAEWAVTERWNP